MSLKFTHLHVHSHYSLLDGLPKIDDLLNYTKELGMDSLALTDHGVLYGAVEFFKKAKASGIKPIIGCELYLAREKMTQKRPNIDNVRYHIVLLAKNETGYKNLVKLVTKAHLEGFYYKPRIDEDLLFKYSDGLIVLTACLQGKIPRLILSNKFDQAEQLALKYKSVFGNDGFFLELQHHPNIPEQKKVNKALIEISKKHHIPLVATNDVHYLQPEDAEIQDILMLINTGAKPDNPERLTLKADDFSLRPPEKMISAFKDIPEAIENTQKIVDLCTFEFELDKSRLPSFSVPDELTPDDYLRKLCLEGLKRKEKEFKQNKKEAEKRLNYELEVIKKTGFAPYFLIVQDLVNWAKNNEIVVGPGRGCFLPGTKILMKDGTLRNIEEIKVGERLITHLGNKRKVKQVLEYNIEEEIAVIKAKMFPFELKLTKDHKVLAARHKLCNVKNAKKTLCKPTCNRSCKKNLWKNYKPEWIEAQDLKKDDFLLYPIPKRRRLKITFDLLKLGLDTHLKGDENFVWYEIGSNKLIPKKVKRFIQLDEKLARLIGYYVAEGWTRTRRNLGEGSVGFGFHKKERKIIQEVRQLLKDTFGIESSVKFHKVKNSCQVLAYSRIVARFFERFCGKEANEKRVPYQIFESEDRIIVAFLTALFKGDGSNKDKMRISFDSISLNLVSQVKMLLAYLGIMASIKARVPKNKNWHISYKLTISGKQLFKFNELFSEFQASIVQQKFYRNDTFIWKNYIWFPIKEVTFENYKGKVYDLTVEKDTSYVANGIAVHNSAGGSLVSYLTGITNINPIKHNLLFERFLNPERISMPDIDLDFADTRRDEVIRYVSQKYGQNHVAQIITFGTMAARAVVRDVGRVLGYPYSFCDKIAKMIPFGYSLDDTLSRIDEFKQAYISDQKIQKLIDISKKLEGVARHASTHACGVVISPQPLDDIVPLQHPTQDDKAIVTQYEMHSIEDLGLLKMDFLGLKNLTIIENTIKLVKKIRKEDIDISEIPFDDRKTFSLLQKGNTNCVFQLESGGMKRCLRQLQPSAFEDIVAILALYRPGPMDFIPTYIARKKNKKRINYLHPKLEPILKETYGIPVFQEQIMQIAQQIAGFTLSEADILRKAIGKKIKKLLVAQKEKFIQGAIKNGVDKKIAQKIWEWFLPFARYGFNRSHSTGYAIVAYQTAYLKAHYPVEFMAAVLASEKQDIERIAFLLEECKRMGIEVLPPDINESFENFTVVDKNKIRFGLLAIKNVGHNVVETIVAERKRGGKFQSFSDFLHRITPKDINKKSLEALIKTGVFDKLEERNKLLYNLDKILEYLREIHRSKSNGQKGLFDSLASHQQNTLPLKEAQPLSNHEKLSWEKELLGLYISGHPLQSFQKALSKITVPIKKIHQELTENNKDRFFSYPFKKSIDVGSRIKSAGVITRIKKIITKNGKPMLFMEVEDLTEKIETIVFPGIIERHSTILQENKIVIVNGKVDLTDNIPKIIVEDIEELIEK